MSVYTTVSVQQLEAFLRRYAVGKLISHEGISDGIENTNYFVNTTLGSYVLTLFESQTAEKIASYMDLTAFLNEHHVRCAHPVADTAGRYLNTLNDRPAALIERLQGHWLERPEEMHIKAVGAELGKMHAAVRSAGTESFSQSMLHRRNARWRSEIGQQLLHRLQVDDRRLLVGELEHQQQLDSAILPSGIIHGDLFRDNVLFNGNKISGLIDFYFAGHDFYLFDLAVIVNDWCLEADNTINTEKCVALLASYHVHRPLEEGEKVCWLFALRAAALRFWLSRLENFFAPRDGELTLQKNPDEFKNILLAHRQYHSNVKQIWI